MTSLEYTVQTTFEPIVVTKLMRVYTTILSLRTQMQKPIRHSLGETMDKTLLAALEYIFEANTMPRPLREAPLSKAVAKLELSKLLLRALMQETNLIKEQHFFELCGQLTECCKMMQGWINYCRQTPK